MRIKLESERLFSVPEMAIIIGVCEATVRKWVQNGKLHRAHTVSNQGAYAVNGRNLRDVLRGDPRFNWRDETVEIPDELKTKYLLAAKDKCMREFSAAEEAMKKEITQLNEIMKELFREEES